MGSFRAQAAMVGVCAAALFVAGTTNVCAEEPFYKGKRVTLLINFAAGGPTDIEGRLFAKYLAKHIDGSPQVIVQNMDAPAASSVRNTSARSRPRTAPSSVISAVRPGSM